MDKDCQIVQDLLPLYIDDACSEASTRLVEAHLPQCPACTGVYEEMKKDTCEKVLEAEARSVIGQHAKAQKRKSLLAGAVIAGILCIPILVCLIVNLAVGHALDWFFIVFTSLLVFASITVVPLVAEKRKGVYTILSFAGSLLLLLLTCAIYTGGNWFWVAGSAVIFGLAVLFFPYIAWQLPLPAFWQKNKGLVVLAVDTALLAVMLVCIGIFCGSQSYWRQMPVIAGYHVAWVWLVFGCCRYLGGSKWLRAGAASILMGIFLFVENNVVNGMLGYGGMPWPQMNWSVWNAMTADGNVKWILLLGSAAVGLIMMAVGVARTVRKKK